MNTLKMGKYTKHESVVFKGSCVPLQKQGIACFIWLS